MTQRTLPVTLVLVSYNKAETIAAVIRSVAGGSLVPDLLVVADDGSDDGTPDIAEIAARLAGLPSRIIRHPRSGRYRLQTMRNSGVANALDGMVMISDSDCLFNTHTLESHLVLHQRNPMAVVSGPRFEFLEGTSGPFTSMYNTLEFSHFPESNYLVPFGANISFRKSLWRRLGGFDRAYEGHYGLDDHEFCLRAELMGATMIADPGAHVFHCPHKTWFGGRAVRHNLQLFRDTFGRDPGHEEWLFVTKRVVPWYWAGNRKRPVLGDRIELDRWGAPPGFQEPLHLQLYESMDPLLEPVAEILESGSQAALDDLRALMNTIDLKLVLTTSAVHHHLRRLSEIVEKVGDTRQVRDRLRSWYDVAARVSGPACTPQS